MSLRVCLSVSLRLSPDAPVFLSAVSRVVALWDVGLGRDWKICMYTSSWELLCECGRSRPIYGKVSNRYWGQRWQHGVYLCGFRAQEAQAVAVRKRRDGCAVGSAQGAGQLPASGGRSQQQLPGHAQARGLPQPAALSHTPPPCQRCVPPCLAHCPPWMSTISCGCYTLLLLMTITPCMTDSFAPAFS